MFGQSMPAPCAKTNSGDYVTRHLPALYYTRLSAATCAANVVPLPAASFGPVSRKFVWVAPDRQNDMEVGTPAQASTWLQNFLEGPSGVLTHAPYTAGPHRRLHLVRHGRRHRHRLDAAAVHRHQPVDAARANRRSP